MLINFKYWFKFYRDENLKYISHLDLLRAFERAIRRSNIPIIYSQGFNPRQKISFALPLAVGISSISEYGEMLLSKKIEGEEIKNEVNKYLPLGLSIMEIVKVGHNLPTIMSKISHAEYNIVSENIIDKLKLEDFFGQKAIPYIKKTKNKESEINLKDYIQELKIDDNQIKVLLKSGSQGHIKPTEFLKSFYKENIDYFNISRVNIFIQESNKLITPFHYAASKMHYIYA